MDTEIKAEVTEPQTTSMASAEVLPVSAATSMASVADMASAASMALASLDALSSPTPASTAKRSMTAAPSNVSAEPASATASAAAAAAVGSSAGVAAAAPAMPKILELPTLSDYLDFRKYLADYYSYRREISKKDLRPYTYAVFSAGANIKSPNYLKMIVEGRRNLSDDMIGKFSKALGLNKEQGEEFRLMVSFGQATDSAERNMYLKELNEFRVNAKLKSGEISRSTWEKVPSWVAWVLYSMIDQEGADFRLPRLREHLRGKASDHEIEEALRSLINSGEVVVDDVTGRPQKARSLMENAEDVPVALVRKLQAELMSLGLESLFRDAPTEREFGTLTVSMTKSEFEDLRFQLRKLRKETQKNNAVRRATSKGERVYQLNLQLFPVTD
jgi:uncharacterized protein (TIGR02147 family)